MLPRFLIPPVFASEEQTERARVFHYVVLLIMLVATVFILAVIVGQPELASWAAFRAGFVDIFGLGAIAMNRAGMRQLASVLFIASLLAFVTVNSLSAGGIRSPGVTYLLAFVLMAGLVLGEAAGIITALVCGAVGLGLVVAEHYGALPAPTIQYSAFSLWLLNCLYIGIVIVLMRLATQGISQALKRAETELAERKLAEQMRDEAERQRAALQAQLIQSQKMEALGTLAGGVAHDFNNLLGAIQGFARLIESDVRPGFPPHSFAQRILTACDRGKDLVEQILAFAHADDQQRSVLSLNQTLQECEPLITAILPATAHLNVVLPHEDLTAAAHRGQISQLVVNLCRNAADSLPGGRGSVSVELARVTEAELAAWDVPPPGKQKMTVGKIDTAQGYACLRVRDDGTGISPEILKRIFDPFFTTKGRGRGTGLGLAVVHGVLETHNYACAVETAPGLGTVFSVYLPLTNAPVLEPALPAQNPPAGNERVLVVDDEPDIADMLMIGLDRLGYNVVAVNDPVEALDAFREDPAAWDAVITDQLMPGMLGTDLLSKLRSTRPDIKTVLCTGFADRADPETSHDIDIFLRKPTDAQAIAHSLRNLFDRAPVPQSEAGRLAAGPVAHH